MKISVVIPTYNEEARIAGTLVVVRDHLAVRGLDGEILVADDGSTDATLRIVESMDPARFPRLRVIASRVNRGKGDAVRRGMLAAEGEVVLFTDADLSTPIDEMDGFLELIAAGHPVVVGSRKLEPDLVSRRQPAYRQFMGRVFSWLSRRLLNPTVTDFTCGFKAFRRDVVEPLFGPLTLHGWAFDSELLYIAHRRGIPVKERPVRWSNRADSRVRLGRDIAASAGGLLVILWNGWRGRYSGAPPT